MEEKTIIRDLRKDDRNAIAAMMRDFPDAYPQYYVDSLELGGIRWLFQYALASKDPAEVKSFVLEVAGIRAGHIAYLRDSRSFKGQVYEIRALVIDKQYQGEDFGKILIRYTLSELKNIGARLVWLQTGKKSVSYYKKLGFSLIARYKHYWGEGKTRYVMGKYLTDGRAANERKECKNPNHSAFCLGGHNEADDFLDDDRMDKLWNRFNR